MDRAPSLPEDGAAKPARERLYGISRLQRAVVQFIRGRILQALGQAALLLILVRLLPVPDFGAYMLVVGLSEMMLVAASFGTLQVGRRYLPQMVVLLSADRLLRFVSTLIGIQVAILCAVLAVFWSAWSAIMPVAGFTPEQIAAARPALLLLLLVPAVNFCCELLDALLEQGRSRLVGSLMIYGRIAGIGLLLYLGMDIDLRAVLAIDAVVVGSGLLLAYLFLYRRLSVLHAGDADGEVPLREIARFAWHMGPVDLMGSTSSPGAVRLVLANAIGIAESGLFAFLQSIQRLVGRYLPGTLLRGIVMPVLVARAFLPGGMAVVETGASLLIKANLLIVAAGTVVIALCGDELVSLLSGGRFPGAGLTLLLMYLALAVIAQRSVIEMVMQITGQTAALRATAVIAPFALVAVWKVAEQGLNAAILVMICAAALANGIATAALVRRRGGFRLEWKGQLSIIASAGAAVGSGLILESAGLGLVSATVAAMALFALMQGLLRPFTPNEFLVVEKAIGPRAARLTLGLLAQRGSGKGAR